MLRQFLSVKIVVQLAIAAGWGLVLWFASKYYSKNITASVKLKADYLKTPTSNALTILGLVVPILVALTSYLYSARPDVDYGSLLSTIILYFGVLILAIWETFAILKKAKEDDTIELTYPNDRRFVTGLGLMYGMLILGLFYFAYFFLFEIKPAASKVEATPQAASSTPYLVQKPVLQIDTPRDDVYASWGRPARASSTEAEYDVREGTVRLTFDDSKRLRQITITKR